MGLFSKKIEKQIASYQQELIETHYREVDNIWICWILTCKLWTRSSRPAIP